MSRKESGLAKVGDGCDGLEGSWSKEEGKSRPREGGTKTKWNKSMLKERVGKEGGTGDGGNSDDGLVVSAAGAAVLSLRAEKIKEGRDSKAPFKVNAPGSATPLEQCSLILNPRKLFRWKQ
jgi:hypothetical protein